MVSFPTSTVIDSGDNLYIQGQDSFHTTKRFTPGGGSQVLVGGGLGSFGTLALTDVPEPSVIALGGLGRGAVLIGRRQRRRV